MTNLSDRRLIKKLRVARKASDSATAKKILSELPTIDPAREVTAVAISKRSKRKGG